MRVNWKLCVRDLWCSVPQKLCWTRKKKNFSHKCNKTTWNENMLKLLTQLKSVTWLNGFSGCNCCIMIHELLRRPQKCFINLRHEKKTFPADVYRWSEGKNLHNYTAEGHRWTHKVFASFMASFESSRLLSFKILKATLCSGDGIMDTNVSGDTRWNF